VAARQIAEQGFEGASVRNIAAEAGVTSGAIYRHFPEGKDQLYREILQIVAESIQKFVLENVRPNSDPLEAIVHACELCWDFFATSPSFAALVVREGLSGGPQSPYFKEHVSYVGVLKRFLEYAQGQGSVRPQLPAHFVFAVGSYCVNFHGATAFRDSIWSAAELAKGRAEYLAFVRALLSPSGESVPTDPVPRSR
jgi:AcrR family transcriptional regulator